MYELVDTMKGNLNAKEKAALAEGEGTSETDCYYALLNYFTQRNTEALVKCKSNSPQSYRLKLLSANDLIISNNSSNGDCENFFKTFAQIFLKFQDFYEGNLYISNLSFLYVFHNNIKTLYT